MNKLAGLVVGTRPAASMGRVSYWIFVCLSIYFWLARPVDAFPPSLESALFFTLAYNLGGKIASTLGRRPKEMRTRHDDKD